MLYAINGTFHFQILTGFNPGHQKEHYLHIFSLLMFSILGVAYLCIIFKKTKEKYKDRKILQQVNVNLKTQDPRLEHQQNDDSIFHEPEMANSAIIVFSILNIKLKPQNLKWKKRINNQRHNPGIL